jgi:glycosyltransferase involved in cell wall biosynthesis
MGYKRKMGRNRVLKMKKKILMVDLGASMAGVEAYLEGLATILHPGADLFAICVLPELAARLQRRGVRVIRLPLFSRVRILRFIVAAVVLSFVVVRYRIRVVQINGFLESILLVPARILNCETVYTRHGPFETEVFKWYRHPAKFVPRIVARYCANLASRLVCVSETVGEVVAPMFVHGRVTVIPNWVTQLPNYKVPSKDAASRTHIIYVGRLERYKGLHLLLEALRGIKDVSLTVVGEGTYRHALEELAIGLDAEFVGFQSDPTAYYNAADIFVMPSLGPEGLPLVALEAMSHSLPCLFSDLPVHSEITENGRAAMLFRSGDVEDLRAKLLTLIECRPRRAQYSENAYRVIESKYHISIARQAYLRLFEVEV